MLFENGVLEGDGPRQDGGGRASLEVNVLLQATRVRRLVRHDAVAVPDALSKHVVNGLCQRKKEFIFKF